MVSMGDSESPRIGSNPVGTTMKIYKLYYDNYFSGRKVITVLARSLAQANELADTKYHKYIHDDDTEFIKVEEIEINSPKVI